MHDLGHTEELTNDKQGKQDKTLSEAMVNPFPEGRDLGMG